MILYNDNEPSACAWLRQLIAEGLLAEGKVDGRPIQEISAADCAGRTRCHFFAGIGGWEYALQLAGWPADRVIWSGSCPCQPFSAAGKRKGGKDERHLWPSFFRLIRECRPGTCFGEQVGGSAGYDWLARVSADLESEGYRVGAADLPAACVGAPHIRQRLFWVADASKQRVRADRHGQDDGTPARNSGEGNQRQRVRSDAGNGIPSGGVANSQCAERRQVQQHHEPASGRQQAADRPGSAGSSAARGVEHPASPGRGEGRGQGRSAEPAGGVGNAASDGQREPEHPGIVARPAEGQSGDEPFLGADRSVCPRTDGFWADAVPILCRDGKTRRIPAEPGLFPLAHGVSGRVAVVRPAQHRQAEVPEEVRHVQRVAALRGAGNAIVPAVAAAFLRAFLETEGGLT